MRKCAGGKKPRSDHFGDASPFDAPPSSLCPGTPLLLLMTLNSEAKYSSGGGRAPRGSSISSLVFADAATVPFSVKRSLNVSSTAEKKKREKKRRMKKTPLFLLSLSLSEEEEDDDDEEDENKRSSNKVSSFSHSSFFAY